MKYKVKGKEGKSSRSTQKKKRKKTSEKRASISEEHKQIEEEKQLQDEVQTNEIKNPFANIMHVKKDRKLSEDIKMNKSKDLFSNLTQEKSTEVKEESKIESLNLDALINTYKTENAIKSVDPLLVFSDEDEEFTENKPNVKSNERKDNEDSKIKPGRFSRAFKMDRRDREKVRSGIINKNERDPTEERASNILMPLMRVSRLLYLQT